MVRGSGSSRNGSASCSSSNGGSKTSRISLASVKSGRYFDTREFNAKVESSIHGSNGGTISIGSSKVSYSVEDQGNDSYKVSYSLVDGVTKLKGSITNNRGRANAEHEAATEITSVFMNMYKNKYQ